MKAGIAPKLVVEQVKNTAAWLCDERPGLSPERVSPGRHVTRSGLQVP